MVASTHVATHNPEVSPATLDGVLWPGDALGRLGRALFPLTNLSIRFVAQKINTGADNVARC
jgi:hypothetical protein